MKYILLSLSVACFSITMHAQDNNGSGNGKQSMETTKSKKEALKEKKEMDKVHVKDQEAMDKQNAQFGEKKRYKKDLKSKAK